MKKILLAVLLLTLSTSASAMTAYFTGKQEQVQTISGQWAWNCQYQVNGQLIWAIFEMSCPHSIEVK